MGVSPGDDEQSTKRTTSSHATASMIPGAGHGTHPSRHPAGRDGPGVIPGARLATSPDSPSSRAEDPQWAPLEDAL
jgi:hypothetical protein